MVIGGLRGEAPQRWRLTALREPWAVGAVVCVVAGTLLADERALEALHRLFWRRAEIRRAVAALGSLFAVHPVRALVCVVLCTGLTLGVEIAPYAVGRALTRFWLTFGMVGAVIYALSACSVAHAPLVISTGVGGSVSFLALTLRDVRLADSPRISRMRAQRLIPALVVGLALAIVLLRATLQVVADVDALIYHVSYARDWMGSLPGLPRAVGPSLGAEISYNYPALLQAVGVAIAKTLGVSVISSIRWVAPLAGVSAVALTRGFAGSDAWFRGWIPAGLILSSPFCVTYMQLPAPYTLDCLFLVILLSLLWRTTTSSRSRLAPFAAIGLLSTAGLFGTVSAICAGIAWLVASVATRDRKPPVSVAPRRGLQRAVACALLLGPLASVSLASAIHAHALLFPWVAWPDGFRFLPRPYWLAARQEIANNAAGEYGAGHGFWHLLHGVGEAAALFPGGLWTLLLLGVAASVAGAAARKLVPPVLALLVTTVALVAADLLWLRYFIPVVVLVSMLIGRGLDAAHRQPRPRWISRALAASLSATALIGLIYGASLGLAGPYDSGFTAVTSYASQGTSPFEDAGALADVGQQLSLAVGDDARAWTEIRSLTAHGLRVGTFDSRSLYVPYKSTIQLDGLAGAIIPRSASRVAVIRRLEAMHVAAVFVPSWFWDDANPATADPLAGWSPILRWVGAPGLRAVAVFEPNREVHAPSVIYAVGRSSARVRAVLAGAPSFSISGAPGTVARVDTHRVEAKVGGTSKGWLSVSAPVTEIAGPVLRLTTVSPEARLNVFEPATPSLFPSSSLAGCERSPDATERTPMLEFAFPGAADGFGFLDVASKGPSPVGVSVAPRYATPTSHLVITACGDPRSLAGAYFPTGSGGGKILFYGSHGKPGGSFTFEYRRMYASPVTVWASDLLRLHPPRRVASLRACGSKWVRARIAAESFGTGLVEMSFSAAAHTGLQLRQLRHSTKAGSSAPKSCSG